MLAVAGQVALEALKLVGPKASAMPSADNKFDAYLTPTRPVPAPTHALTPSARSQELGRRSVKLQRVV